MNKREKPPITCSECKQEFCAPCGQFATPIDYKTRTGVCKGCAKKQGETIAVKSVIADTGKLFERANAHSLLGAGKVKTIADCLKQVEAQTGATAELGVYKGGSALLIASTAPGSPCYLFDTFEGIPFQGEGDVHKVGDFNDASLGAVQSLLKDCPNAHYRIGLFPETANGLENETFKFVHIDGDQYQTTKDALEYFYPRMVDGGIMLFDDYQWQNCPGVAKALREFLADKVEELEHPTQHQALIVRGKVTDKSVVNVYTSGLGIGDAICALYAACGAAKVGHKVRFYTDKAAWLARASYPNVEIVPSGARVGHDVNPNYDGQLMERPDRKQWYCDNLARAMGVETFTPESPNVDTGITEKRISFKNYVLFSPFSAYTSREWAKDRWRELAQLFINDGYAVVALHGKGEKVEAKLTEYFGDISGAHWFWGMDAEWIADAMLGAEAIIGNDSGMAHYAALLGVKTVAIHSHCLPEQLWGKTSVIPVVSQNYDCVGCNWKPKYGFRAECNRGCAALNDVTPMQVFKAAFGKPSPESVVGDRPVYFLHIPKTAGTSINRFLDKQFPEEQILKHEVWNYLLPNMPTTWERFKLIHGHYGYSVMRLLPKKPFLMTFLRDPIERTLSQFHHMRNDPHYNNWVKAENISGDLSEMLERWSEFFNNNQTRYISRDIDVLLSAQNAQGYLYDSDPLFLKQCPDQLEVAQNRLREEFHFVGITENADAEIRRLCALTGWNPNSFRSLNVSPDRPKKNDYAPEIIERIAELNQDDIALYEFAKELNQSRV